MNDKKYKINGYKVIHSYAGIDQYTVYENEKYIGTCWDVCTVAKLTKTDVETVQNEFWKQR